MRSRAVLAVVAFFVLQSFTSVVRGQDLSDIDSRLATKVTFDPGIQSYVADVAIGDTVYQIAVLAGFIDALADQRTSEGDAESADLGGASKKDETFSSVSVPGKLPGNDGRAYSFLATPGSGVEFTVDNSTVFVDEHVLGYAFGLYESVTGQQKNISSLGRNERGDLNLLVEGVVSNHSLVVVAVLVSFFLMIMALGVSLIRARRENRIAVQTRKRMIRAREDERRHLASELHDGPLQELQFVGRSMLQDDRLNSSRTLSTLDHVTDTLRRICTDLRPEILSHFGLVLAIESLCDEMRARQPDLEIELSAEAKHNTLGPDIDLALYRILQEAMNNVVKHAGATRISVSLQIDDEWAELSISDNGSGFDYQGKKHLLVENGNLGLIGMMQRATAIDAAFEVKSSESGTLVRVVTRHNKALDQSVRKNGVGAGLNTFIKSVRT